MKKIDTSFDSPTLGRPFLSRSLDHVQQAYTEITDSVIKGLLGSYTANDVIVLYGCVLTGTDPGARTVTAGSIYYNGEVYLVDAASLTTSGSNIPLWTIVTTYQSGDPILFSDNATTHNVSQIIKFVLVSGTTGGSGVSGYVADYNGATVKYLDQYIAKTDGVKLRTKVIEIGDWNMSTTSFVDVAHGLTPMNIRHVAATVRSDTGSTPFIFDGWNNSIPGPNGYISIQSTTITLERSGAGLFTGSSFDATSFNRGWVTITYEA